METVGVVSVYLLAGIAFILLIGAVVDYVGFRRSEPMERSRDVASLNGRININDRSVRDTYNDVASLKQEVEGLEEKMWHVETRLVSMREQLDASSDASHIDRGYSGVWHGRVPVSVSDVVSQLLKKLDLEIEDFVPDAAQTSEVDSRFRLVEKTDGDKKKPSKTA